MTHYEERLEHDLTDLRESVVRLASDVESNLRDAIRALLTRDNELGYRVILYDGPINRESERVEAQAHAFIARHLPSAGHLRFVSAVMRIVIQLERMGDYAVTICRESVQFETELSGSFRAEVQAMAEDSLQMLGQAMKAFSERDESLARGTMGFAAQVDRDFVVAFDMLVELADKGVDARELFGRLVIITQIERVSDQAKNLCEETVFALTGQTKKRRLVRVLFVDDRDAGNTQLAVAIGRKQCGDRSEFASAGRQPAAQIDPAVASFLGDHGYDSAELKPSGIDWPVEGWSAFDVIVSLSGPVQQYVSPVPFQTVALEWDIPSPAENDQALEQQYRMLSSSIGDLIETMRGAPQD